MPLQPWQSTTQATAGLRQFSFSLVVVALFNCNSSHGGRVILTDSMERSDGEMK